LSAGLPASLLTELKEREKKKKKKEYPNGETKKKKKRGGKPIRKFREKDRANNEKTGVGLVENYDGLSQVPGTV
jgi:hypothetical protein